MVVGVDSYISVDNADKLIRSRFMSSSKERKFWDGLDLEDKEIIIVSTTEQYDTDTMLYKGRKKDANQPLQFPRLDNYGNIIEVPERVILGYILIGIYDNIISQSDEATLKLSGVKSFADGSGARIEFGGASDISQEYTKNSMGIFNGLFNKYIKQYTLLV